MRKCINDANLSTKSIRQLNLSSYMTFINCLHLSTWFIESVYKFYNATEAFQPLRNESQKYSLKNHGFHLTLACA